MLKLLDKIICLLSIFAMIGLLGAYSSSYIDPNLFVIPSLLGLAYPYLLISNLLLSLYWFIRWKKMIWAELGVILLGIPTFMSYYGTAKTETTKDKHNLSILSYNVRYFDSYGWSNQIDTKQKLLNYLNKFTGDIICLQEFMLTSSPLRQQEIIKKLKSYPHSYIYKDMAIFSRIPFCRKGHLTFDKAYSSACIYGDIVVHGDTVRLYSVHLESYRLGKKERQFVKEMSEGLKSNDIPGGMKNLTIRLTTANKYRALQAEQIKKHLQRSPYKVILCGDFNDTPLSYTYREIKNGLQDAFIEKGRGLGNTYIGEFPSFRIDYILHTPDIQTIGYVRDHVLLSDHYPIQSKLKI